MQLSLILHPESQCDAVSSIDVDIVRSGDAGLSLLFAVSGDISRIELPDMSLAKRKNQLWQHSCFELFIRPVGEQAYHEYNFSPSREWAAYWFSDWRVDMTDLPLDDAPLITTAPRDRELAVSVQFASPTLPVNSVWQIGLSAVIEEIDGNISYWALAHPLGKANFHHETCLALELPPFAVMDRP
jgi:hypothetical protein